MASLRTDSLFSVKGYVAVVTGGCSGIGLMISKVSKLNVTWITQYLHPFILLLIY